MFTDDETNNRVNERMNIWWLMKEWRQRMNNSQQTTHKSEKLLHVCVCGALMEKRLTCWVNVDVNLITSNDLSSEMNHFSECKYKHIANSTWPILLTDIQHVLEKMSFIAIENCIIHTYDHIGDDNDNNPFLNGSIKSKAEKNEQNRDKHHHIRRLNCVDHNLQRTNMVGTCRPKTYFDVRHVSQV